MSRPPAEYTPFRRSALPPNREHELLGSLRGLKDGRRGILTMIIIINGSLGVGKSSVAEELHWKFDKSVHLDGDYIGDVHPFGIYDEARLDHLYRTLALLIDFHQQNGYHSFVINYVFESPDSLQSLIALLRPLDPSIHTYWLTCDEEE